MTTDVGVLLDAVRLSMSVEEARARVAAHNIAMANVPGSRSMRLELGDAMQALQLAHGDASAFKQALHTLQAMDLSAQVMPHRDAAPVALDSEVADLSAASGRYQALADSVSRQFALMQLAMRGGR
ncbi:MAG: flagellar biosynthesis protein FlgB [Acinetobacter sp.]|nr:flagellar biosynthesis protein FlgB [Acinetobacter sp.]